MHAPLISVIVPVYNVEAYLHGCLSSIATQTFTDFECILVDDGSSDHSGVICDEWAAKDPRFVAIHKKNAGVSAARNSGMEKAQGHYLVFCDCDDQFHPQTLELALSVQRNVPPHTLVCWKHGPDFSVERPSPSCSEPRQIEKFFIEGDFTGVWSKLWNRELLSGFSLRFDETLPWCEDLDFVTRYFLALLKSENSLEIQVIPYVLYRYNALRPGNTTSQYSSAKLIYELQTLPTLLKLFQHLLNDNTARWAPFCQTELFMLMGRLLDFERYETGLSRFARRRQIRKYLASPPMCQLLALCHKHHVWPAMYFCAKHRLVGPCFFLERNCYKRWYTQLIRSFQWIRNKFYWGWQALKSLLPTKKG